MSWKGAVRQIERDQQRRARVTAQEFKQLQKDQVVASASQAVASYNDYLVVIQSMHHDCSPSVDWAAMQRESAPEAPEPSTFHEVMAEADLILYEPSFFDRLFKRGATKRERLEQAVAVAKQLDQQITAKGQVEQARQHAEWQERQNLTAQVLVKNEEVYRKVLEAFAPWGGVSDLVSSLEFTFTADHIEIDVNVNTAAVIPDFVVSQLASGKLSRKAMPSGKFNELYQDYVCSCLLRVAREVLAHLPVSQVVVHAFAKQLNTATGLVERQVIVSASMPRSTMETLNFTALDPSDSMQNFNHTMKFTKTLGFQAVERVGLAAPLASPRNRR